MIPALENLELEETGRGGNTTFDFHEDIYANCCHKTNPIIIMNCDCAELL